MARSLEVWGYWTMEFFRVQALCYFRGGPSPLPSPTRVEIVARAVCAHAGEGGSGLGFFGGEVFHEIRQGLAAFNRHRVVNARADAADGAVAFQADHAVLAGR